MIQSIAFLAIGMTTSHRDGANGNDFAYRHLVVDRYVAIARARRRGKTLCVVDAASRVAFATCACGAKALIAVKSFTHAFDRAYAPLFATCVIGVLLDYAAWRGLSAKQNGTKAAKRSALALALASVANALANVIDRFRNVREEHTAAWVIAEGTSRAMKRAFDVDVAPGALYAACVNVETLSEVVAVALPFGVYGICLGMESHFEKKVK